MSRNVFMSVVSFRRVFFHTSVWCRTSSGLRSTRVALRKRFGQHLLKNPDVVKAIVALAGVQPYETAFEIGPGTGNLTMHLLKSCRMLYAVELDRDMHRMIIGRVHGAGLSHKFQCICGDFLAAPLPPFDVLCANIPYQISSPVLDRLFFHRPLPKRAVIMFQLEFAQRMVARPGSSQYCRLSVNCALLCSSVRLAMRVGREQFRPPPQVDSAVVEFIPRDAPHPWLRQPGELLEWDAFLRLLFSSKNKTLRSLFGHSKPLLILMTVLRKKSDHSVPGLCSNSLAAAGCVVAEGLWNRAEESEGKKVLRSAAGSCTRAELEVTRNAIFAAISGAVRGSVEFEAGDAMQTSAEPLLRKRSAGPVSTHSAKDGAATYITLLAARPNALHVTDLLAVFMKLRLAGFAFPVVEKGQTSCEVQHSDIDLSGSRNPLFSDLQPDAADHLFANDECELFDAASEVANEP